MKKKASQFNKSEEILNAILNLTPFPTFVIDYPDSRELPKKDSTSFFKEMLDKIIVIEANEAAKEYCNISSFETPTLVRNLFPEPVSYSILNLLIKTQDSRTASYEKFKSEVNLGHEITQISLTPIKLPEDERIVFLLHIINRIAVRETDPPLEFGNTQLLSLFDSIDEVIYISNPITYDIIFVNEYLRNLISGDIDGKKCYEAFHGFESPCEFCTNEIILELDGDPYHWEYHNKQFDMVFKITDRIISWEGGKKARFEIAVDITKEKKNQRRLKIAKQHAELIVNTVQSPMVVISTDFKVVSVNRAYTQLFDVETSDCIGQSLFQINANIWDDSSLKHILTEIIEHSTQHNDFRIKVETPKFGERIFSINARKIYREGNSSKTILLSFIDITDQIRIIELEKEARFYAEKRLEAFMDASPIAFLIMSSDLHVIAANTSATELFPKYSVQKDLVGKHISEMYLPFSDTERLERYRSVIKENQVFLSEDTLTQRGFKKHFSTKFFKVADGLGIIARDVTESRVLMHSLQERVKEMTCLLDTSKIIRDESMDIETAIPEIIPVIQAGWQFPEITAVRIQIEDRVYTSENYRESEYKQRAKISIDDNDLGWLEVAYIESPPYEDIFLVEEYQLIEALGTQIGAVIVRRRAQEMQSQLNLELEKRIDERTKQLREAQEQLLRKERLALLGELSGSIGHELRNPLSAIKNAAYFLNMVLEEPDTEVKESIDIIQKEIERCNRIIEGLLDYARPRKIEYKYVDLTDIIHESIEKVKFPDDVELITEFEKISSTFVDSQQMEIVFINLFTNAIQAMNEEGKLTVSVEEKDDHIIIVVSDTGIGIPKINQEKVFQPLFTTKTHGIGFGLSIVHNLILAHNGTIDFVSEEGVGTTFTIRIPVEEEKV